MGLVKSPRQIVHIRNLAAKISAILAESIRITKSGMTTKQLDAEIELLLEKSGVRGSSKGYHGFPAVSCISVNSVVTHGIPDGTIIKEGDLVDIDLVIEKDGYYADISKTIGIDRIGDMARHLMNTAEECLVKAIRIVAPRTTLGDIGFAIQSHAESNGFSVVREFCGHFIGTEMHEGPPVTNYGRPNEGLALEPGMILCIEPMLNEGRRGVVSEGYGWNVRTRDNKLSSRCEHMVLVTGDGHQVLTTHPFNAVDMAAPHVTLVPSR